MINRKERKLLSTISPCQLTVAHQPHRRANKLGFWCPGTAPEYPDDVCLSSQEAIDAEWRRYGGMPNKPLVVDHD